MAPSSVLGTATLFCRPLRFLFDVESSVAVLRNDAFACSSSPIDAVLGHVHVHISLSFPADDPTCGRCTSDGHGATRSQQQDTELAELVGRFAHVRVRLQLSGDEDQEHDAPRRKWRVQYQLAPATESFVVPADHTNVFRVLVTDEFVSHITTTALQFNVLPPRQPELEEEDEPKALSLKTPRPAETSAYVTTGPLVSAEEAEAVRRLTEVAVNAAHSAAQAAREAARAATSALEETKSVTSQRASEREEQQRQLERQRDREREHEQDALLHAQENVRATSEARAQAAAAEAKSQTAAAVAARALEKQQYEHELERVGEEKQRLRDDAERLARALDEKDAAMGSWHQQTASTDAAIELLKQRLAGDAKERDELQRRLRVLEEEKLELLRKSRACTVQ